MDDHEEATARLRVIFATWAIADFESGPGDHSFEHCDFSELDRLLAARDRVVAANAWDEGYNVGGHAASGDYSGIYGGNGQEPPNPYRITEENN